MLKGFRGLKTNTYRLEKSLFLIKQQKENQLVITKKNKKPRQKLTERVVSE